MLHDEILNKINEKFIACKVGYHKHNTAAAYYKNWYIKSTLPVILLSSITTVLASYGTSAQNVYVSSSVAILSGIITIIQAINSFLEYNAKYDAHYNCANNYITLADIIETEYYIGLYKKQSDEEHFEFVKNMMEKIQKTFTSIKMAEPYLPNFIQTAIYNGVVCGSSDINAPLFNSPAFRPRGDEPANIP